MSFKLFIYYCALCGAWAALVAYLVSLALIGVLPQSVQQSVLVKAVIFASCLGILVALSLGFVDAMWNSGGRQMAQAFTKAVVMGLLGGLCGVVGGFIGQSLVSVASLVARQQMDFLNVVGWVLTGLLIGASIGAYDAVLGGGRKGVAVGAVRKVRNGVLGGLTGGLIGGICYLVLKWGLPLLVRREDLLSSGSWGFVALGACIGLFIGLAQVILMEAWVKVESGFRAGRELMLSKGEITIGRAESCDIGLFGDNTIERTHARIVLKGNRYLLADTGTPSGTFLNDERITQPTPLRSGDEIRVGKSVLRFGERQKRK